jgi:hypothetical protein
MHSASPELEARRKNLGTFRKQLEDARGPIYDGMTGLLLIAVISLIGMQTWNVLS